MLDPDYIRNNPELVKQNAKNKNIQVDIDQFLKLDKRVRQLQKQIDKLRQERNIISKQNVTKELISKAKKLKNKIQQLEKELKQLREEREKILVTIPNVVYPEVPVGKDESGNQEIRRWGKVSEFDFKPKSHIQLAEKWDLIDFERGSKVSGYRGYFLKNELAVLHLALLWFAFTKLIAKGYTPIIAPAIVKEFTLFGCGQFPWGRRETYELNDNDSFLAGTAEQPVTSYFAGEILEEKNLPYKFVAFSPCYRREAGSYGKDTRGVYRVHEFYKIEQVIISTADDDQARQLHEELQNNTEEIWQELNLPYRVLLMCTGDMGEPQAKKYDTEVWMPYRKGWGEVASNSIMTDFQSRRLNIKYRTKDNSSKYVYTLNDTALPSPRALIAIIENYQQSDSTIKVPDVLQKFTGFDTIPSGKF